MGQLIVVAFEEEDTAKEALEALRSVQQEGAASITDAAVVAKDPDGKAHVKGTLEGTTIGGAAVGGALGLLLFMFFPVLGLAVGAIAGGLIGHAVGDHIDSAFVKDVTAKLDAGHSALFVLIGDGSIGCDPRRAATHRGRHDHPDDAGPGARGAGPPGRQLGLRRPVFDVDFDFAGSVRTNATDRSTQRSIAASSASRSSGRVTYPRIGRPGIGSNEPPPRARSSVSASAGRRTNQAVLCRPVARLPPTNPDG